MHRPRKEMIAETRAKLIAAARHAFGTVGYAESSMDDFTASAGLTRGALYHHFGDKKGLLQAVIAEIDREMALRVNEVASRAPTRWQHFVDECTTYIEMALEPEIQRIMFRDGPAVLGDPAQWPNASACIASMTDHLTKLQEEGVVVTDVDPETTSRLINGASSQAAQRIANSNDPEATSKKAIAAFKQLLEGLRQKP
ncbi:MULTISPECIES: TetR/AcrR family transcriptional regulator [unclassified Mesorhizobium]|uniref:TetR/AcrR family transcriptional regulator n=1 Tax=unclassified Mesorhizobium TaxID=325217 RepID=UPI000F75E7F4|nr:MULTISPECIES: TetR/AcrR family transcriptional regulator [unclassified Mesorhizobium]AZO05948.1 TetR/AcrR family transcriptional regulator [Mesorhizobium sp. M2A.F.Ca.ET.043.02.1.1]RUW40119.1 TetR/AcrR family transcriptional regulator [Mesorhizobium sp. M2A.F.Ca.ET.015.02.1.1]RUW69956.1 TetR/AcrR family transcriptional regulator [Mesorhizobium sp. M2A.F.Ca.ET.067.02.1.1]RVC93396.1 TetR/AcrR family transcriptional regulator [Mesorhizobium sp. M2A.F.Ca.ET.017.03.2.1]RVD08473.1 TetR/AcrR famil